MNDESFLSGPESITDDIILHQAYKIRVLHGLGGQFVYFTTIIAIA